MNDWEARYRAARAASDASRQDRPDPLLEQVWDKILHDPEAAPGHGTKRALDLACGAGGNALWLAERGWDVTAVDRSPTALELIRIGASKNGVEIACRIADLEAHEFEIAPGAWDLILMCRYLQRDLFEPARLGLAPGGVLIVITLLASEGPCEQRFRVQPGELARHFAGGEGFTVIHAREGATRDHHRAEIVIRRDA